MSPPDDVSDPAADHEPSRPDAKWMTIAVIVVIFGLAIANWSQVSAFAHLPQIEHALGFG